MSIFDETLTMNNGLKIPKMALGVWEIPDTQTPKAVEEAVKIGYRHIDTAQAYGNERGVGEGVKNSSVAGDSSFEKEDLDNIIKNSSTKPAVNQILVHIGETPMDLINYSQENDIVVEAFSPIAHGAALNNPQVKQMADKYGVSVPQLCIRYDWQLNCVVLPKSANPEHMKSNAEIDFKISDEDMAELKKFTPVDYGKADIFPVFGGKM